MKKLILIAAALAIATAMPVMTPMAVFAASTEEPKQPTPPQGAVCQTNAEALETLIKERDALAKQLKQEQQDAINKINDLLPGALAQLGYPANTTNARELASAKALASQSEEYQKLVAIARATGRKLDILQKKIDALNKKCKTNPDDPYNPGGTTKPADGGKGGKGGKGDKQPPTNVDVCQDPKTGKICVTTVEGGVHCQVAGTTPVNPGPGKVGDVVAACKKAEQTVDHATRCDNGKLVCYNPNDLTEHGNEFCPKDAKGKQMKEGQACFQVKLTP